MGTPQARAHAAGSDDAGSIQAGAETCDRQTRDDRAHDDRARDDRAHDDRAHDIPCLEALHAARLFDDNAAWYDRVNTVITFGLDARWRRWAARQALRTAAPEGAADPESAWGTATAPPRHPSVLDACSGTGLVAVELARRGALVTAVDASARMLERARARLARLPAPHTLVIADLAAEAPPPIAGPFAAVTLVFGLRYFTDPVALLARLRTLLAPGGRLVVVEAVRPGAGPVAMLADFYFFRIVPRVGAWLAGKADLYHCLSASTAAFGQSERIVDLLRDAGFMVVGRRRFAGGLVAGFVAAPTAAV